MVMTERVRPNVSVAGATLAVMVALVGWASVPAWAVPDAPPQAGRSAGTVAEEPVPQVVVLGEVEAGEPEQKVVLSADRILLVQDTDEGDESAALIDELERLECHLQALARELAQLRARMPDRSARRPTRPRASTPPAPPVPPAPSVPPASPGPPAPPGYSATGVRRAGEAATAQTYRLSSGKLKALTDLMVRSDVPILVGLEEDGLVVHATPPQHKCFAAFVEMIHPSERDKSSRCDPDKGRTTAKAYALPKGKLKALTKLMLRSDVPIRVRRGDEKLTVHATPEQHQCFSAFVELIHPTSGRVRPPQARARAGEETVVRSYRLPRGKLEALTRLMIRPDVPVLVRRQDDRIEIHASPEQHKRIKAFIEVIHPDGADDGGGQSRESAAAGGGGVTEVDRPEADVEHERRDSTTGVLR